MSDTNEAPAAAEGTKPKLLIIDDSKVVLLTAKKMLSSKFEVLLAKDGEDGWSKLVENTDVRVVFTDLGMPKLDGYGFIERVRKSDNEALNQLPLIVITGAAEDESIKQRILGVGATDFISKPFRATELIARADSHIHYQRRQRALAAQTNIDPVTQVLNQSGILEQLGKDKAFVQRHNENLIIALLSLDGFDNLYQKLGQRNIEVIMKRIAQVCKSELRKEDNIGCNSKGEFLITLPMSKTRGALILARRLIEKIASVKLKLGSEVVRLSVSIGAAVLKKNDTSSIEDLLSSAKTALSNGRSIGDGQVQFLHSDRDEAFEDINMEDAKPSAISIDSLLADIKEGRVSDVDEQFLSLCQTLQPILALLNIEQKQKLTDWV